MIGNIAKSDPLNHQHAVEKIVFLALQKEGVTVAGDVLPTGWNVRNVKQIKSLLYIMEKLEKMGILRD